MRYEDSHTGAFQGSGPVANDDLDAVAAGSRSPATGNLITGEGTQTGSAGADSAIGAHITALAGKGGEDTSFSGGMLSVVGEHGKLSVDAEGNYKYQPNSGVENVRDRFTYTLADNQGATDSAFLIVEIGKTPVVIKANATQIVPGPDGVVTLPPGVELADVHVVGRNLVVDMPDGTQLVIVDGAVFVPQLVLDGVEVPATNVAALLVGQEIQPAAGELPPSSGGNFEAPVPPLDPGVPLGDLIPPTDYNYVPPEPLPTENIVDREPTITIQPDGQPAAVNAIDVVDEDGLPARNGGEPEGSDEGADGNPSNNSDSDETTGGVINYDSPDGVDSITINGVVVASVGQVIAGAYGSLTITSIANGQIGYSYTLADNTSGDNTHDDFSVTITDDDGDQATATLTIDIIDDVPTARPDTDASVDGVATGNVMTDAAPGDVGDSDTNAADTVGADNASLTAVSGFGGSSDSTFEGGLLNVNGQFGSLAIDAQGNYTYTVNPNVGGGGVDVFTYTLTDGDGDTTTATLTITNPDLHPDLPNPEAVLLDDDALPGGNAGGDGDDPDSQGLPGQLVGTGGDGDLDYNFTGVDTLPAGFTTHTVDASTVQILQGATVVLTITLNNEDGSFNVVQNNPIDHPVASTTEDNLQFSIGVEVEDSDGDVEPASITINVDDDTPTIGRADVSLPTLHVDETDLAANASANFSTVFNGHYGADGPGTTSYAVSVVNGTDSGLVDVATGQAILLYNIGGVVTGSTSATLAGVNAGNTDFTVSVNSATGVVTLDQIQALVHPVNPDPDDAVSPDPSSIQLTATITDADGDPAHLTVNIGGQLVFDDDGPSVNPVLNADATVTVDESLPSNTPGIDTGAIVKGDDPDLAGGLAIGQANSGAAIVDANAAFGADGPAAGGGISYALSITDAASGVTLTDGSAINLQLVGGVIVGVVAAGAFAGEAAFAIAIDPATGVVTVEQYLSLDHPVNPDPNDALGLGDNTVAVTVTATDGDGDSVTSGAVDVSHQITFLDDGPSLNPAVNAQATVQVDESLPSSVAAINTGAIVKGDDPDLAGGLAIGQANSGVAVVNANAVFGADGPAAGGGLDYELSITNPASGVTLTDGSAINLQLVGGVIVGVVASGAFAGEAAFAIAIDSATGVVSVEQYLSLDHPVNPDPDDVLGLGNNTVGVTVTATDGDGDPVSSGAIDISGQISFRDDGPTINPSLNSDATVTVDESLPSNTPGIDTGAIVKGDDPDLAGGLAIGQANSGSAIVNANAVFGADGPAAGGGIGYALSITNVSSGVTLTDGSAINLQLVGGVVVGVVASGAFSGQAAFAIAIDPTTGVVTVEQYLSLDHPVNPNPNDPLGLGDNTVAVTVTATDGDGDPVTSGAIDVSHQITFLDDGPSLNPAVNANSTVTVDESLPSSAAAINTGAIVKGDDPDLPGGLALGQSNSGSAIVNANAVFGADGPAAGGGISYALSILNASSGLTLTDGTPINLQLVGGVIVGVVNGGAFNGQAAYAIAINSTTGVVSVEQYLSLDHPLNPNPNDPLSFGSNVIGVTVTATDGDGDPVTSPAVDIGGQLTFLDDGPTAANDVDSIVGGNGPATGNVITGVDIVGGDANATDGSADAPGADGGHITAIASNNVPANVDTDPSANFIIAGQYGVLTLNANGDYSYLRNDGTPGGVSDVFTYTLTDGDGDPVTATLTIGIDDKFPTAGNIDALVDDDDVSGANGNPGVPANGDEVPSNASGNLPGSGGDGALTWDLLLTGAPAGFSYADGANGSVNVFQTGNPNPVMNITINPATGAYTITELQPILHPSLDGQAGDNTENNVSFTINYTVTDADGDPANGTLHISVDDDTPIATATLLTGTVDEDGVPGGIAGGTGDVAGEVVSATGNVSTLFAAGADAPLTYSLLNNFAGLPALTSGGVAVTYGVNFAGGVYTLTASAGANTVFTLTLNAATGAYNFTLVDQIDHPTLNGQAGDNTENDLSINLGSIIQATDHDGDSVTANSNGLIITVDDDMPVAAISTTGLSISIDESAGNQADSNDVTGPLSAFNGVANKGDDPDVVGTVIQFATSTGAVSSAGSGVGADAPGSIVKSLDVSGAGVDSGLNTTDGTDILLYNEGGVIVGRVGSQAGAAAFALAIDPVTGQISMVEYLSIQHPNAANADDSVSIANGAVVAVITASDADGDTVSTSTPIGSLISFQDSGPVMTSASNINIQNSGDVAHTGAFAFNLGADGAMTNNDVIKTVVGSATVNGSPVSNYTLTPGAETATTASYTFSFDYSTGIGTAHETGTLVFDKAAGTYTVDLDNPIQGISTLQTAQGTAFTGYVFNTTTVTGSQPDVAVTTIRAETTPGVSHDGFYVQFTGFTMGNGSHETIGDGTPATFVNGDLISEGTSLHQSWVSATGSSNGVAGDTVNGPDGLNFNLYSSDPKGLFSGQTGNTPTASAQNMFLRFDGVDSGDDMVVVLKLWSDANSNGVVDAGETTTKALVIQGSDIYLFGGSGAGSEEGNTAAALAGSPYQSIVAGIIAEGGSNNNDGLVIIESNDYNSAGQNYSIIGAEIVNVAGGITGTGINLNSGVGAGGGSSTSEAIADVTDTSPLKITNIGFLSQSTTNQNAHLTFDVTIQDGDGDTVTQTITADVTQSADSSTPIALSAAVTTIVPVAIDLNGDGVQFLAHNAGVHYDYNGDGVKEATAWVGPHDGILVHDANGNGTVDGASEFVFGGNGVTDLQALAAQYGTTLDANDADYAKFGVWQDANSNGVVDAGEYQSLANAGIASINLVSDGHAYSAAGGDVEVAGSATYTNTDGSTGAVADASFSTGAKAVEEKQVLNSSSSNIALAAAVAAAGLAGAQAAAAPAHDHGGKDHQDADSSSSHGHQVAAVAPADADTSHSALANETKEVANDSAPVASSSHGSDASASSDHALDNSPAKPAAELGDHQATHDQGPVSSALAANPVAPSVGVPSAEALHAAGLTGGHAQHGGLVAQVVAEALGHGDAPATVDALLNALPGGNGHAPANAHVASPAHGAVSGWDMPTHGAFGHAADMMMKMGAQMLHHDAVQPAHNG